ncbi:hypothetical protein [Engelhardtia mirabilis]|uniref:Uncharacterized protein n=1 Tax=Engelhardtia mirabilis TaxID=2528011 RepID=A0A518BLV1_9BACT|nr:hypothetical protein Pla133_30490 [Planctomycetes bacterium Pla133]QDV02284.1 hypothetical protein Pla86_30480 [Planctomycetes bacterium Pla86]
MEAINQSSFRKLRLVGSTVVIFLLALTRAEAGSRTGQAADLEPIALEELDPDAVFVTGYSSGLFGQRFDATALGHAVVRTRKERASDAEPWSVATGEESVSFTVTHLAAAAGGDVLWVAGYDDANNGVLERWMFDRRPGGWSVTWVAQGGAISGGSAVRSILGGGPFVAPESTQLPAAERQRMLTLPGVLPAKIAVTPDGEQVYFYSHLEKAIYHSSVVEHSADPLDDELTTPSPVVTSAEVPVLGTLSQMMVWSDAEHGLQLVAYLRGSYSPTEPPYRVLVVDSDEDGIVDEPTWMTKSQWKQLPYGAPGHWDRLWWE